MSIKYISRDCTIHRCNRLSCYIFINICWIIIKCKIDQTSCSCWAGWNVFYLELWDAISFITPSQLGQPGEQICVAHINRKNVWARGTQTCFDKLSMRYVEIFVGSIVLNVVAFRDGYSYRGDNRFSSDSVVVKLSTSFASYLSRCSCSFSLGFTLFVLSISFSDIHVVLILQSFIFKYIKTLFHNRQHHLRIFYYAI